MCPNNTHTLFRCSALLLCLGLLAACGQSGPLYLPDTNAETAAPGQAAESQQQAPGQEQDGEPVNDITPDPIPDPADPENDDLP